MAHRRMTEARLEPGFTLIELLVVIAIISLMRALADPANGKKCLDPLLMSVYAQRGVPLTDEMLVGIIQQIGVQ